MDKIHVLDRDFVKSISQEKILERVQAVAARLDADYAGTTPVMVCILNGAFVFAADLVRAVTAFQPEVVFARFSSYEGTSTTGKVKTLMGLTADITGRDVIIVEDIVETGLTLASAVPYLLERGAKSVRIACLLQKPERLQADLTVDYCAMEIPNDFILGYGLDYDGLGRNYKDIYVTK